MRIFLRMNFSKKNENTTVQLDDSFDDTSRRFVRRIQELEVREALKMMKGDKAMGPDGVEMSRGYRYSMANQDVQQYLSIEQNA